MKKTFFVVLACLLIATLFPRGLLGKIKTFPSPNGKQEAYMLTAKTDKGYFPEIDIASIPYVKDKLVSIYFTGEKKERGRVIVENTSLVWSGDSRYLAFETRISEEDWYIWEIMVYDTNPKTPKDKRFVIVGEGWSVESYSFKGTVLTAKFEIEPDYSNKKMKCKAGENVSKMLKVEKDFSKPKNKVKKTSYSQCVGSHD